jgi:release factor glutamine methyltransferase
MTVGSWLNYARAELKSDPDAAACAVWICEEVLNIPRARLRFMNDSELTGDQERALESALDRRRSGEPVQYIFSRAPFMGFEFYVDKRVLIPRMDTETLCDAAASDYLKKNPRAAVLDLCAGSGAIGISLAKMFPGANVTLSDISPDASDVQRINAQGVPNVEILTGDMFETVAGRDFDMITCNPPYIRSSDMGGLQMEVRAEPALALDGGADGLAFYRLLARKYRDFLRPGGRIYMEIGFDQAADVCALFENARVIRDLNGLDRVIWTEV